MAERRWDALRWVTATLALLGVLSAGVVAWLSNADKRVLVVLGLVVAAVVAWLVSPAQHALTLLRQRRAVLDRAAVGGGRLPRLGDVSLEDLGVRVPRQVSGRSRPQLPYAGRHELDPALTEAMSRHRFVLVHGPSAAGKSRSAAEAARRLWPDRRVLVADPASGLLEGVLDSGTRLSEVVVWLDDLNEHLGAGLTAGLVRRLLDWPGLRIVATMRAAAYTNYQPRAGLRPSGADVLEMAEEVVFTGWDDRDRTQARTQLADHVEITAALDRGMGLGDYLVAGPELVARLEKGNPPADGIAGQTIVRVAADWYRAGLNRPAPIALVERLYPAYLPADDATLLDRFDAGLAWASDPATGHRMITRRTDGVGVAVHDYLLDHLAATLPPGLPTPTWTAIADELTTAGEIDDLAIAGVTAHLTHHAPTTAEDILGTAARAGNTNAMSNLGVLLAERGETVEAEPWLRTAAQAGNTTAMSNLGVLWAERGEMAEAERWLRTAARAGGSEAMGNLGILLQKRGEAVEGERWLRSAARAGGSDAMYNLGVGLAERGETAEAERWYGSAGRAGHADALCNLGVLLAERGETAEAKRSLRTAAQAGNTTAMYNLGILLTKQGEMAEAERWYRNAAQAGNTTAMTNLGVLLAERGEMAEAEGWYRGAALAGDTTAMTNLGVLLAERGETAEAEGWYRNAAQAGDTAEM